MYGFLNFGASRAEVLPSSEIKKCTALPLTEVKDGHLKSVPIPFTSENRDAFIGEVFHSGHTSPRFRDRKIYIKDINFATHLKSLYIALDAYLDSSNPVMTPQEILWGCAGGPKYAKTLKTSRLLSYIRSMDLHLLYTPETYEDIPVYPIKDIGDIFNFQYLFFWEEVTEDWKNGLIFCPKIKDVFIKEFKEKLFKLLPDSCERVNALEILLDVTSSSSTDSKTYKPSKQWKERSRSTGVQFSTSPLKGRRTVIQIGPGNVRDTVVLPLDQVNTIRFLDAQIWEILSLMSGHAMVKDADLQRRIISEFESHSNFFYCRDLQKEGLTKPRELLTAMLEVLQERYPYMECFRYKSIYEGYTLLVDNEEVGLARGHGLGMANALTTLMNIVIFHLTIDEIWRHESVEGRVDSLSYNDDFVAGFETENDLESYYSYEDDVLDRYGLMRKPEKSFKGHKSFVFLEVYYPSRLNRKESYYRREVLNSLSCSNIVHAKELINSLSSVAQPEILTCYLAEIISKFGFEFFPGEERLPFTLGGWIGYRFRNVSLDLKVYFDSNEHYDARVLRSYKAAQTSVNMVKRGAKDHFVSPLERLLPIAMDVDSPIFRRRYLLDMTRGEISSSHESIRAHPELSRLYWDRRRKKRLEVFGQYPNIYDRLQAYEEIIKDYPVDFIAPITLPHDVFHVIESEVIRPRDAYRLSCNPLLASISGYTGIKYPDVYPSKYEGLVSHRRRFHHITEGYETLGVPNSLRSQIAGGSFLFSEKFTPVLPLANGPLEKEFLESFNDPTDAWLAARSVGLSYIPFRKERKIAFLEEKKSVFGRLLTLQEIRIINVEHVNNPYVIKVLVDEDYFSSFRQDCLTETGIPPWYVPVPEEEELPPDETSDEVSPYDNLPDMWSSTYTGDPIYYRTWESLRGKINTYDVYTSIHGVSASDMGTKLALNMEELSLWKRTGGRVIFHLGSIYIDHSSPGGIWDSASNSEDDVPFVPDDW